MGDMGKVLASGSSIGEWIQKALDLIQTTRAHMGWRGKTSKKSNKYYKACRHIRATPNNPESSRGHLFTMLDVVFQAHVDGEDQKDKIGKIVIVDCAGSEDPVSIMKDY